MLKKSKRAAVRNKNWRVGKDVAIVWGEDG